MLQLKNICKKYETGGFTQTALDDVSLNLRDNEFVAILGPSGSGKTTLLNIIGGLDRYDSGDLIINGVSTKKYRDRDWDSYRNHTVGFVFQSYNLISHQTVLQNVELALTIGGISADRRKQMALDALDKVGLKEQAHKKPNQMSGGQMQRVAIARALVNDPKILLADEPTGALDTKTSVQVMDLLKEVANDRLVVMVTHNPELAEQYSNRIVRLKDGRITDDTNPLSLVSEEPAVHRNLGKASMSLATSFGLSLNNLMTKKGRTILTAFAGSIGIIGIALILALSTGFQNYIDQVQEETMNSYPLTINAEAGDLASIILSMREEAQHKSEGNFMREQQYITSFTDSISNNDLKSFMDYLDEHPEEYSEDVRLIKRAYSVTPLIYTIDGADNLAQIYPSTAANQSSGMMSGLMLGGSGGMTAFSEIIEPERLKEEYTLLYGSWPSKYNELVLSVNDPNQISDLLLYSLGFRDTKELTDIIKSLYMGDEIDIHNEPMTVSYDDLLGRELKLVDRTALYKYNDEYEIYEDMTDDDDYMMEVYENAEPLKITGIIYKPQGNGSSSSSTTGVLYLPELTSYVMDKARNTEIVSRQLTDPDYDVFSGNSFDEEGEDDELDFEDMISIDEDLLAEAFVINMDLDGMDGLNMDPDAMSDIVMNSAKATADSIDELTQTMVKGVTEADAAFAKGIIDGYKQIATIPITTSDAPETKPDVSAVTGILQQQMDAIAQETGSKIRPNVETAVKMLISRTTKRLQAAKTVEEAEAVIDELELDEDTAAQLKSTIREVPAEGGDSGSGGEGAGSGGEGAGSGGESGGSSGEGSGSGGEGSGSGGEGAGSGGEGAGSGDEGAGSSGGGAGASGEGEGSADTGTTVDVTQTVAAIEGMEETLVDAGVDLAIKQACKSVQDISDALESAQTKAEADAVIDKMDIDDTQKALLKTQIKKQYEKGGKESTEKYLTLDYRDVYKEQAITEEKISEMTGSIEQIKLDPANTKKIVEEAFDNYYGSLTPDENGMVAVKDLPSTETAVQKALTDNSSALFEEGYNLAKDYMALLVAKGTGEALAEAMSPLSALGDLFGGGEDIMTFDTDKFAEAFQFNKDQDELSRIMEAMITGKNASYKGNLLKLGYQNGEEPTSISFYFYDFESKNRFMEFLERYNDNAAESQKLEYTDITGILMGSVEKIVNAVTYVLIAFVSISLVVSSIMIGIITYISVLERTKEIGILRAIGASKRNISSIFNAETCIIGLLSGIIGVVVTRLLLFPINDLIHKLTEIDDITAVLELPAAIVLVAIATGLTMLGGLIPSQSASKKDPVIALRTE